MWSSARTVAEGDTIIVWLTRDQLQPLVVTPGKDLNTKFGNFKHADLVGVPYGSKVASRGASGRGFIHVLRPTPELWTLALPHRTQILYLADIAFITAALNVRRGSRVVEAGTGSASFSHSIARTIGRAGRLFSFEFHEARFLKAREEFRRHGLLNGMVRLQHRNVCKDGFGVSGVDAVFLDLPAPWEAVGYAKEAMRKDRIARICCFSPCIEQVLRTVSALNDAGFTEITMHETLLRPIEVFQTPKLPSVGEAAAELKRAEVRREEKRQRQIAANRRAVEEAREGKEAKEREGKREEGGKRKVVDDEEGEGEEEPEHKRARVDVPSTPGVASTASSTRPRTTTSAPQKINVAKALAEVRGHTSYLTFASLVPVPAGYAGRTEAGSSSNGGSGGGDTPVVKVENAT
ncbi:tRNA methyltransferase complex GCD14 subunit [Pholiota conissans]|uniref:tRNA (adenine(58)-N(1))-methyltransferase catalytic subunit TRM61 n=1 Tax=Pholiota conissans TaxID=109636 RepID=A0A9P6D7E8_9AGAR|nr:tRNA methyltransferase complex GCD14 subunit [Pholiota conissans]